MIRKIMLILAVLAFGIGISAVSAQADSNVVKAPKGYSEQFVPLNATSGYHNVTLYSDTVDNRRARMYVRYEIDAYSGSDFRLDQVLYETDWNSHPAFKGNAVRLDLQLHACTNPGEYTEISPAWGGSSTTLDDMPSYYSQFYVGNDAWLFGKTCDPRLRVRFYGVGAGAIENRSDDSALVE